MKMDFWVVNAPLIASIEGFIIYSVRFTASYVISKIKKKKLSLTELMNKVPAGNGIWGETREKLFKWQRQLELLHVHAKDCDDKNAVMGSILHEDDIETMTNNASIFNMPNISTQIRNATTFKRKRSESPESSISLINADEKKNNSTPQIIITSTKTNEPQKKEQKLDLIDNTFIDDLMTSLTNDILNTEKIEKVQQTNPNPPRVVLIKKPKISTKKLMIGSSSSKEIKQSKNDVAEINVGDENSRTKKSCDSLTMSDFDKFMNENIPSSTLNINEPQKIEKVQQTNLDPPRVVVIKKPKISTKKLMIGSSSSSKEIKQSKDDVAEIVVGSDDDICEEESVRGKYLITEVDIGREEITDDDHDGNGVKMYMPENLDDYEIAFMLKCSSKKPINYHGFQFESQSDFLEYRTVSVLIRRRELLLQKFHDAQVNGERFDKMSKQELLTLYRRASEAFVLQYKKLAQKFNIEEKEKTLNELMREVEPTNTSNASQFYAIEGNVKDLSRLVMSEKDMPCPMRVLNLFIQHICLYGTVFGKGGSSMAHLHNNVTPGNVTLFCERYGEEDKNFEPIESKTIMYVGRPDLIDLMESMIIHIAGVAGVKGNNPRDIGQKVPSKRFYDGLKLLYFVGIKFTDPFEVFLFRALPVVKTDGFSLLIYSLIVYLNVGKLTPCDLCAKIIKFPLNAHMNNHRKFYETGPNVRHKHCGFQCYIELAALLVAKSKTVFGIKDIVKYIMSLDKILNDIYGLTSLFNSIGMVRVSSFSSFMNVPTIVYYYKEKSCIMTMKPPRLTEDCQTMKNVSSFLKEFISSKSFQSSFLFLDKDEVKINL